MVSRSMSALVSRWRSCLVESSSVSDSAASTSDWSFLRAALPRQPGHHEDAREHEQQRRIAHECQQQVIGARVQAHAPAILTSASLSVHMRLGTALRGEGGSLLTFFGTPFGRGRAPPPFTPPRVDRPRLKPGLWRCRAICRCRTRLRKTAWLKHGHWARQRQPTVNLVAVYRRGVKGGGARPRPQGAEA